MIHSVIFDWKRTLYNPDDGTLIAGSKEILEALKRHGIPLMLIGKGEDDMHAEVKKLGVERYFTNIVFQGGPKKDILFKPYIFKDNPSSTLFIGDRIRSELAVGKSLGATTIWVRQGKFAEEIPENKNQKPDYTVASLAEAKVLLAEEFGFE